MTTTKSQAPVPAVAPAPLVEIGLPVDTKQAEATRVPVTRT